MVSFWWCRHVDSCLKISPLYTSINFDNRSDMTWVKIVGVETNCFQNQSQHFDLIVKNDSDFATLRFGPCLSAHMMVKLNAYLNLTANCRSS